MSCFDYESVRALSKNSKVPVISYGSKAGSLIRFYPDKVEFRDGKTFFEVKDQGKTLGRLSLQIPGMAQRLKTRCSLDTVCRVGDSP